jgi:hypothetical protein
MAQFRDTFIRSFIAAHRLAASAVIPDCRRS